MAMKTVAGQWLAENGNFKYPKLAMWRQHKHADTDLARHVRDKLKRECPREFVERNRHHTGQDCLFVPDAHSHRAQTVSFLGRTISAARYMALLAHGTPKDPKHVVRHTCGNGHKSCVNPGHLLWGTAQENRSDAAKHRHAKTAEDKINIIFGKL